MQQALRERKLNKGGLGAAARARWQLSWAPALTAGHVPSSLALVAEGGSTGVPDEGRLSLPCGSQRGRRRKMGFLGAYSARCCQKACHINSLSPHQPWTEVPKPFLVFRVLVTFIQ